MWWPHYGIVILLLKKLKLYGLIFTATGLEDDQNWEKCDDTILRLSRRLPPYGVSVFGKIHFIQIYYLCMFNYLVKILTPPVPLVDRANKAIVRFLWYPSKSNVIGRDVLKLSPWEGGIGFPDLEIRAKVNRLMLLVRVLTSKEELSWRRCFNHFYTTIENSTLRQLNNFNNIPIIYKEIRTAVVQTRFVRVGDFCWFFGEKMAISTLTANKLYARRVKEKFAVNLNNKHIFWSQHLWWCAA